MPRKNGYKRHILMCILPIFTARLNFATLYHLDYLAGFKAGKRPLRYRACTTENPIDLPLPHSLKLPLQEKRAGQKTDHRFRLMLRFFRSPFLLGMAVWRKVPISWTRGLAGVGRAGPTISQFQFQNPPVDKICEAQLWRLTISRFWSCEKAGREEVKSSSHSFLKSSWSHFACWLFLSSA